MLIYIRCSVFVKFLVFTATNSFSATVIIIIIYPTGDNQITELPRSLTLMSSLTCLSLTKNKLHRLHPDVFYGKISSTLKTLDMSHNQIDFLPASICLLTRLETLDVRNNKLQRLPITLRRLTDLKNLIVSHNQLPSLPSSVMEMRLTKLSFMGNPTLESLIPPHTNQPYDLVELSARTLLSKYSCALNKIKCLPKTLQARLRQYALCDFCRKPTVNSRVVSATPSHITDIRAREVERDPQQDNIAAFAVCCSYRCFSFIKWRSEYLA